MESRLLLFLHLFSPAFIEIYSIVISSLGMLLAMYLLLMRKNNDNQYLNNLLSVIILSSCFHFVRNFLISSGWIMEVPWAYGSFSMIYLLAPPVTYLYIRGILNDEYHFKKRDLIHLIPPFVQLLLSANYIFSSHEKKLEIVKSINNFNNLLNSTSFNGIPHKIFFAMVFVSVLYYAVLSFIQLRSRKTILTTEHNKAVYRWTITLTYIMILMAVLMLVNVVVTSMKIKETQQLVFFGPFYEFRLLLFTIVLVMIVYSDGLRLGVPNFAQNIRILESLSDEAEINHDESKLASGILTDEQTQTYRRLLIQFFENNPNIYTQMPFNVDDLSVATNIPKHHWAYFFRYYSDVSFVDMRNGYRIEHAKKLMQLRAFQHYTIEAIGEAAGFGSRTTFFNAFKKHQNMSPSEYWEQLKL